MKIEVGEYILYSWLRHICKCQLVQLNWKYSPEWQQISADREEGLDEIVNLAKKEFGDDIFKKSFNSQIIKQGEIDAIGLSNEQEGTSKLYGCDVAFHGFGLRYGKTKEEAIKRIIRKCIRSAISIWTYFDIDQCDVDIVFASPHVNPGIASVLLEKESVLNEFIHNTIGKKYKKFKKYNVNFIINEDFKIKIASSVMDLKDISDTSELFLRSVQLLKLVYGNKFEGYYSNKTE